MLHKTRFPVPNKSLLLLYYSLVYPYLTYCNRVLHIPLTLKESTCYREELFEQFLAADDRGPSRPLFQKLGIFDINRL